MQVANQPSFLRRGKSCSSFANLEPLPSFLTQTPLGTPHEGIVELKQKVKIPQKKHLNNMGKSPPSKIPISQTSKFFSHEVERGIEGSRELRTSYKGMGIYRWVNGEIKLSMSKMSIMSLVFGLLFLGFLFFIIGFLAAVATLVPNDRPDAHSAWQASNTPQDQGTGTGKLGFMAGRVAEGYIGNSVRKQLAPVNRALGGAAAVVPRPLQPFARYGMGKIHMEATSAVRQVNPFAAHLRRRERIPAVDQQPYSPVQSPPRILQQYPTQQPQAYGPPGIYHSPQVDHQVPSPVPQEAPIGMRGYVPAYPPPQQQQQQPIMMQQPYLQPSPQAMVSQPAMPPQQVMMPMVQMLPQQQMAVPVQQQVMQPPPYPQAMVPQPGYYQ